LAWRSELAALGALVVSVTFSGSAKAGGPVGPNGSRLETSSYAVDLYQGPIFAGSRVTSLGGSYVAISEDVDGDLQNPATPAVRPFFSYTNFDYWLGFGLTFPATLSNMDFFNSGSKTSIANPPDSFVFFTPSINLQFGELGIGLSLEVQQYQLSAAGDANPVRATIPTTHVQFAHGLFHNQIVLGVGARFASLGIEQAEQRNSLNFNSVDFKSSGQGLEVGAVFKPENRPLRLGIAFRSAIVTQATYRDNLLPNENGDLVVSGAGTNQVYLPKSVALPWDLNFGFAVEFGKRPHNLPWRTVEENIERETLNHRLAEMDREKRELAALAQATTNAERQRIKQQFEREQAADDAELDRAWKSARSRKEQALKAMNRFYVQLTGSMLISGSVKDAVGVESLVSQTVNRSGERAVVSPRVGAEVSVVPDIFKIRGGSYVEPTRFDTSSPRVHATAGFDLRLLVWNVFGLWPDDYMWRLGVGADVASRYSTWGLTIAGWYPRQGGEPTPSAPVGAVP
jgi:hypothetical protein